MVELKRGDFFCVDNPGGLASCIKWIEKIKSKDNCAEFGHCGTILDSDGNTVESLVTIRYGNINNYVSRNILIGRWNGMTNEGHALGVAAITGDIGQAYPFWRLPLFIFGLAKFVSTGKFKVCSERVALHLITAGFKAIGCWKGQNPDDIADMIRRWRDIEVVLDGVWQPG
jgi:hypothetical protein